MNEGNKNEMETEMKWRQGKWNKEMKKRKQKIVSNENKRKQWTEIKLSTHHIQRKSVNLKRIEKPKSQ